MARIVAYIIYYFFLPLHFRFIHNIQHNNNDKNDWKSFFVYVITRGVYSSLHLDILPHPHFFNLDFLPQIFNAPPLIFFPTAWILKRREYFFPISFYHVIFFPTTLILPSPLPNVKVFPHRLDKLSFILPWWSLFKNLS